MLLLDLTSSMGTEDRFPVLLEICLELCGAPLLTPRLTDLDFFVAPPPLRGSLGLSRFLLPLLGSPCLGLPADILLGDCVASKSFDCTLVENRTESSSEDLSGTAPWGTAEEEVPTAEESWLETDEKAWDKAFGETGPENSETPLPKDFASSLR